MEHLALEVFDRTSDKSLKLTGSKFAALDPDASISITDTSEIFASGDVWSHSFKLNVYANVHIFGTAGDMHGSRLHEQIDKRRARLWMDGMPVYLGYLMLGDEAEVDENGDVDVSFESGQKTFTDMIDGGNANQVPLMDDVMFGVALWRRRKVSVGLKLTATAYFSDGRDAESEEIKKDAWNGVFFTKDGNQESVQQYPRMVFPKGWFKRTSEVLPYEVNCLNTDSPYEEDEDGTPTHPYCNIGLCYQQQDYLKKNDKGELVPDYTQEPEAQRGYEKMPADRVNSAPCFFVLYWLRCLMKHVGIYVAENQALGVEDLRRLFFVNTNCAYREVEKKEDCNISFGGGRLIAEYFKSDSTLINIEDSHFDVDSFWPEDPYIRSKINPGEKIYLSGQPTIDGLQINIESVLAMDKNQYVDDNSFLHSAYATSDCFPNVSISEVITALENGFGMRFLFDREYQRVRIVLLRNIFRSNEVQDIVCEVNDKVKVENNIRGVRMTYNKGKEDTSFYYKGFADKLPHEKELWTDDSDKHDYSQWNLNATFKDVLSNVTAFNKTCYVTPVNGNAYGIKVDKDGKRYEELHPSSFEFAGYMDAEDGDCTGDKDTVKEISVGFTPAIMNDLGTAYDRYKNRKQFYLFVDEKMHPRRPDLGDGQDYNSSGVVYSVAKMYELFGPNSSNQKTSEDGIVKPGEFAITSDMAAKADGLDTTVQTVYSITPGEFTPIVEYMYYHIKWIDISGWINEGYRLYLQDNYEPNDDGVSPIETRDWGLTLGIMRGSGSNAYVEYSANWLEGEDNYTWKKVPGNSVSAHPDTCDDYGDLWDYNGSQPGVGDLDGRVSLKLRAEKPNPYYVPGLPDIIRTKEEAASAMTKIYTTCNTDLLNRPKVPNSTMRAAGWDAPGDGYATVYSIGLGVLLSDGVVHEILFTPIKENGTVKTSAQLQAYANNFTNMSPNAITAHDGEHLVLDINTTTDRAEVLHQLQAVYYAEDGEDVAPVNISSINSKFLSITKPELRQRGLMDQFYKEYSYLLINGKIAKLPVNMELAQLLTIDKTKRVRVGDIMGFIRKIQYTFSNKTGLGGITLDIIYI